MKLWCPLSRRKPGPIHPPLVRLTCGPRPFAGEACVIVCRHELPCFLVVAHRRCRPGGHETCVQPAVPAEAGTHSFAARDAEMWIPAFVFRRGRVPYCRRLEPPLFLSGDAGVAGVHQSGGTSPKGRPSSVLCCVRSLPSDPDELVTIGV